MIRLRLQDAVIDISEAYQDALAIGVTADEWRPCPCCSDQADSSAGVRTPFFRCRLSFPLTRLEVLPVSRPVTFEEFAFDFVRHYAVVRFKATTVEQYRSLLRIHVLPVLGTRPIAEITAPELHRYVADRLLAGLSPRTVRNHVVALRRMFSVATVWGLVTEDPSAGLESPRPSKQPVPFLKPEELRRLVESTPIDYRLVTALPAYCGLRRGEVLSLRFDHVSLSARTMLIEFSKRGDSIHDTKSRASTATVPFPPSLMPMFEHRRDLVADQKGLVLCKKDGSPLADSFANRVLKAALVRADLPSVTYHQLRGSWVYAHLETGTPLPVIQQLGRWADVSTLIRSYGRWLPNAGGDAAEALDALLGGRQ